MSEIRRLLAIPGSHVTLDVVVGALQESSSATGINGDQANNNALYSGAAYVFHEPTAVVALTPIERWRQQHFGITTNTGDAANSADPDRDGVANLLEYGLVTNPRKGPGEPPVPKVAHAAGDRYLQTSFTRDPARNDVNIRVETVDDLAGPWSTVASSIKGADTTGAGSSARQTSQTGSSKSKSVTPSPPAPPCGASCASSWNRAGNPVEATPVRSSSGDAERAPQEP